MVCTAPSLTVENGTASLFSDSAAEWDDLLRRSYDTRLFLSATWLGIWWAHFGTGTARVVTARDTDGTLQAALPLQITRPGRERVISLVGDYNVSDYMDGLAEKRRATELLRCLWYQVFDDGGFDRVDLRHVPSSSPLIDALQMVTPEYGMEVLVSADEVCPVAVLCNSWDRYLQTLTKVQRHEIKRKLRRFTAREDWSWRTSKTLTELNRDLGSLFVLHGKSAGDKQNFLTPSMRNYFGALAAAFHRTGITRLSVLRRAGKDMAATLSFVYRDRYFLYNSAYNPAEAELSPGIAAVALAMQDAMSEGAVAFDFLSGDERYKYQFGATNTYTVRVTAAPG